jgi:hypothetical protein
MRSRVVDTPAGAGADRGVATGLVAIGPGDGPKAERMLARFKELPDGAMLWTRQGDGSYRLGRIAGPYYYDGSDAAQLLGLPHARAARWLDERFDEERTPRPVVETFARGGRNLQQIRHPDAAWGSSELWARSVA